jgi:hypothetical protein
MVILVAICFTNTDDRHYEQVTAGSQESVYVTCVWAFITKNVIVVTANDGSKEVSTGASKEVSSNLRILVVVKNGFFWDVTPYGYCKNRRFGGT